MIKKNLAHISKKSKMIAATAFVLGIVAVGGSASIANAAETPINGNTIHNPMSDLVSAIATKFNLTPADVQAVVDNVMKIKHDEMEAKGKAMLVTRLSEAVTAGKLTQAQSDLIVAKAAELKSNMEANRSSEQNLTPEQRKAKMDTARASLEQWATANNIPKEYWRFAFGGSGMGRAGHGGPHGGF